MLKTIDVVPYCGVILAHATGHVGLVSIAQKIKERISAGKATTWLAHDYDNAPDGGSYISCFFSYTQTPHWSPLAAILDVCHAYFSVGMTNGYVVLHCSDNEVKDMVLELLDSNELPLEKVAREVLNYAFIAKSAVKTIWLHGIHSRTQVKADSKALTGSNLRLALDPSADQSYSYNSMRGTVDLSKKERTLGINLNDAYLWLYRLSSWKELLDICDQLTSILRGARGKTIGAPLDTVSHPISNISAANGAFDFAIADPSDPAATQYGATQAALMAKIASEFLYEIDPAVQPDSVARVRIHHVSSGLRSYIGEIHATPILKNKKMSFSTAKVNIARGQSRKLDEFARVFSHPSLIRVWYDSGHAIAGGACYQLGYRSVPFRGLCWGDFTNFDLLKEKPNTPASQFSSSIGTDDSLFSWVYKALERGGRRGGPLSHLRMKTSDDWLLCDDGSGEVADFVHATTNEGAHHLTLIHVKAANSNRPDRKISVSAHDVVINQAVKNIGSLSKENLISGLSSRVKPASHKAAWTVKNNVITAVPASDFVSAISSWSPGRVRCHVVIVQPHTLRRVYRRASTSKSYLQLCTLLNAAAIQVAGMGGVLTVVGSRT